MNPFLKTIKSLSVTFYLYLSLYHFAVVWIYCGEKLYAYFFYKKINQMKKKNMKKLRNQRDSVPLKVH